MLSDLSVCSDKTATALEIRYGKEYMGITAGICDKIDVGDVTVKTCPTGHTVGSTAFYWENDVGTRILVTGDVKDYSMLPSCDVLITEANYGDVGDFSCYFQDDIEGLKSILDNGGRAAFGAYSFGKTQRLVRLFRDMGYRGPIEMEDDTKELTEKLMDNPGELVSIGESGKDGICLVPPWNLKLLSGDIPRYVITGRCDYPYPSIQISDHLDVNGLIDMVNTIDPQITIVYHPGGHRPQCFAGYLNSIGKDSISIGDISNVLSNEFT